MTEGMNDLFSLLTPFNNWTNEAKGIYNLPSS